MPGGRVPEQVVAAAGEVHLLQQAAVDGVILLGVMVEDGVLRVQDLEVRLRGGGARRSNSLVGMYRVVGFVIIL